MNPLPPNPHLLPRRSLKLRVLSHDQHWARVAVEGWKQKAYLSLSEAPPQTIHDEFLIEQKGRKLYLYPSAPLKAQEAKQRAKDLAQQWLGYVQTQAEEGRIYTKGKAVVTEQLAMLEPLEQKLLQEALEKAQAKARHIRINILLLRIEEAAQKGHYQHKAHQELQELLQLQPLLAQDQITAITQQVDKAKETRLQVRHSQLKPQP